MLQIGHKKEEKSHDKCGKLKFVHRTDRGLLESKSDSCGILWSRWWQEELYCKECAVPVQASARQANWSRMFSGPRAVCNNVPQSILSSPDPCSSNAHARFKIL
ncbi:hypothetical protein Tco_1532448 [Tanacetum coccineum]